MDPQLSEGQIKENTLRGGGFNDDEVAQWRSETAQKLQDGGFSDQEVNNYFGKKEPNMNPAKDIVKKNLASATEASTDGAKKREPIDVSPRPVEAKDIWDAMAAGWGDSLTGLFTSGKPSPIAMPSNASVAQSFASNVAGLVGDAPGIAAGMSAGGGPESPAGWALSGAVPKAMRKMLVDQYQKGEVQDAGDFARRVVDTTWEAVKGAATNYATMAVGGNIAAVNAIGSPIAKALTGTAARLAAENVAMTTVSSALEGHLPGLRDFENGAVALAGLHAIGHVVGGGLRTPDKLQNIYAETGASPNEIIDAANNDPSLKGQILSDNPDLPKEAAGISPEEEFKKTGETLYHGTRADFADFKQKADQVMGLPQQNQTHYFTDDPRVAKDYSETEYEIERNGAPRVITAKVYGKTLDLTDGKAWPKYLVEALKNSDDIHDKALYKDYNSDSGLSEDNFINYEYSPTIKKYASENGYGKVKHPDVHDGGGPGYSIMVPDARYIEHGSNDPLKMAAPPEPKETPSPPTKEILPQKVKPGFELPDDARSEVLSRIGEEPEETKESMLQKAKDGSLDFYVNTFDKTARLKDILDKIGDDNLDEKNSYVLARTFSDVNSKVDQVINKNTIDPLTNNKNGEGLMKILTDYSKETGDKDLNNLKSFMISARSLELDKRGIEQPGDRANDQAVFEAGKDTYDKYAKRLVDFQNRNLDYAQGNGLLSEDQVKAMKDANQYYIPLHKIVEADNLTGKKGSPNSFKKIGDSLLQLRDPIDSMFKNTEVLIKAADRNDIMRQAAKDLMQGDGLAEEIEKDNKVTNVSKEELNQALKSQDITLNDQSLDGFSVFRKVPSQYRGPGIFTFRDDGALRVMKTDPKVAEVLNSYSDNYQAMGMFTRIFRTAAQGLRAATIQNPLTGFFARHIIRNQEQAAVFSQTGLKPFQAIGDLVTGKDGEMWDQFIRDGGAVSSMEKIPEGYYTDTIKKMDQKMPFVDKAWNIIDTVTGFSHAAIMANDNMIRFKEYQRTLNQGASRTEATMNARNVLADFQKEGLKRGFIQSTTAFFKAHYQGEFQMFGALADPEQRMGVLARNIGYITVPSVMLGLAQASDQRINDLPDWLKYNYWNVHIPNWRDARLDEAMSQQNAYPDEVRQKPDGSYQVNDGYVFRIPKPFANGAFFGSAVEEMINDYQKKDPEHFGKFLSAVGQKMVAGPIPTLLEPVLEQATNRNFFGGKPLVRSEMERNKLPEMQYTPYTSELAKFLGRHIADVPLLRDIGPGDAKLASPLVIDNYMDAYTGGSAKYILGTVDKMMGASQKGIGPVLSDISATKLEEAPFFREFMVRHNMEPQSVMDFMDSQNLAQQVRGSIKDMMKRGDMAGVVDLQDRYATQGIKVGHYQEGIQNMMSMIHKVNDSNMDPTQKRQLSDGYSYMIISAAHHGNQIIENLKSDMKGK